MSHSHTPAHPAPPRAPRPPHARRIVTPLLSLALAVLLTAPLALAAPQPAAAQSPVPALCQQLTDVATSNPGVIVGMVMVDLRSGDRCEHNPHRPLRTASLYKTVVMAEVYRQVAAGLISLDQTVTVEARHHLIDPPEFRPATPYTFTVAQAINSMIVFSSNGTAEALMEFIGFASVDAALRWLGMPATSLGTTFLSSAADQAHLYSQIFHGRVVDRASSAAMLDTLARQEVTDLFPQGLPPGTRIAHKTGTLDIYLNDAGIIYAPGGEFVLVALTEHTTFNGATAVIQQLAATAYAPYAIPSPPLLDETAIAASISSPGDGTPITRPSTTDTSPGTSESPTTPADTTPADNTTVTEVSPPATEASPPAASNTFLTPITNAISDARAEAAENPALLAGLLAFLALAFGAPLWLLRRRSTARNAQNAYIEVANSPTSTYGLSYGMSASSPEDARSRADRSERGLVMRFGSRREDEAPRPVSPASRSISEVAEQPVLPSKRLQRVAEHFRTQGELLSTMRDQFEEEMEPLHDLIVKQAGAMQDLLQNLEERLRPLNEYADGEEANLAALEQRIQAGGQDHVARSFSQYLEEQRNRIGETRDQIDRQRLPFLEYGDAQRETVETALSRFDGDIEALEANLAEQRRVMVRMLDAMRSDTFTAVKDYLAGRQEVLAEMAQSGSTDPAEISRAAAELRRDMEAIAGKSDYVRALLQQADSADRALADAAPSPRPLRPEPTLVEVDEDYEEDEDSDEATA